MLLASLALSLAAADPPRAFTLGGYVEANVQWNFNEPSNGLTNLRGFDNRHDTFTLSNVALELGFDDGDLLGRLSLQVGHTPSTYYLAEPALGGSGGANATGGELWKFLQQAYAGCRLGAVELTAGLFLSPIGPESIAIKDDWNYSRSNLFFGLPFYHTGLRAGVHLSEAWSLNLLATNGWNSIVDNNPEKSLSAQALYASPELTVSILYFTGVERPTGAPEGRAWRHLFDAHATWNVSERLSLLAHADAGFEPNFLGVSRWASGALYARFELLEGLYLAARGDLFYEDPDGAAAIFWPAPWVGSGTATIDYRPLERVSFKLEYRHDHAGGAAFFGGEVDAANTPNRRSQDTLTLGVTAWL